jgi:acyl-CoA synthetase (AMP-forming)/AMP-acid ligase II
MKSKTADSPALPPEANLPNYLGSDVELPGHQGKYLTLSDLGYLDREGYLYLVDRSSEMFITGGENVYPREIELVLLEHPSIRDAAVVGYPHDDLGMIAKAYVVAGQEVSKQEILNHCLQSLSGPRVPAHIEFVERLPRDASGKMRYGSLRSAVSHILQRCRPKG